MIVGFIFLAIAFGAAIFALSESGWITWVSKETPESDPMAAVWMVIENSLLTEPQEWACNGYTVINQKRKIGIWIANEDYGLGVSLDAGTGSQVYDSGKKPSAIWRKRLLEAYVQHVASGVVRRFSGEEA